MRVLWLIDSLNEGGAEALAAAFATAAAEGIAVEVAFLKRLGGNPHEERLRRAGVPLHAIGARHLRDLAAFRRLRTLLATDRFDLLHAHLAYASIWGALAAPAAGLPLVASLHVEPAPPGLSREAVRQALLVRLLERRAARVVAVSAALAAHWRERGLGPEIVAVVPNGIDPAPFAEARQLGAGSAIRRELGISAEAEVMATVAVLRPGKGIEDLIAAMPRVLRARPRAVLVIAGDGPRRAALERQAEGLGLGDAVRWAGRRRDVPAVLAAADLFVLPSHRDAFPTVLLEAMGAALPVVASRVGGIPEIVVDGATGVLVRAGDVGGLAAACGDLLAAPERRRRLGEAGRRRLGDRFTLHAWRGALTALYAEVLGRSPEAAA